MAPTPLSIVLGSSLTVLCGTSCILNIVVLLALWRGRHLSGKFSTVYILAFSNMLGNCIQMALYALYLGPSCIIQEFLFFPKEHEVTKLMGFIFHGFWTFDLYMQDLTSINRTIVIVFPSNAAALSRKRTITATFIALVAGFGTVWLADYYFPCCSIYLSYKNYAYSFLDSGFNYANYYVDIPSNIVCSIIAAACYALICSHVRLSNRRASNLIIKSVQQTRRSQELRHAFQFAFCTVCCIITWVGFRALSAILPPGKEPFLFAMTIFLAIHCCANAIVILAFNTDVRTSFFRHVLGRHSHPPSFGPVAVTQATRIMPTPSVAVAVVQSQSDKTPKVIALARRFSEPRKLTRRRDTLA